MRALGALAEADHVSRAQLVLAVRHAQSGTPGDDEQPLLDAVLVVVGESALPWLKLVEAGAESLRSDPLPHHRTPPGVPRSIAPLEVELPVEEVERLHHAYPPRVRLAAAIAAALTVAVSAAAAPPTAGVLVPGTSLGELRLGATKAQVERAWGRAYGRCTGCRHETWYFNYFAFQPAGAGVEFRDGRAVALFTIYQPPGWRTSNALSLGAPVQRVRTLYRGLDRRECDGYYALILPRAGTITAFYVLDKRLWAFGLSRSGIDVCR